MSLVSDCFDSAILPLSGFGRGDNSLIARRRRRSLLRIGACLLVLGTAAAMWPAISAGAEPAPTATIGPDTPKPVAAAPRPARAVRVIPIWNVPAGQDAP